MKFQEQEAYRQWLLESLSQVDHFLAEDPDFRGNRAYERETLGHQWRYVEDGKYRVAFLGTFNVGKSTAINAFLGGAFLPMDVEECTSRLTFIQRGEVLELRLRLRESPAPSEIAALEKILAPLPASVVFGEQDTDLRICFPEPSAEAMRKSLEPLVTVLADDETPDLAPLREKIEELMLLLPASVLEEDIIFVDTPGVHSISDTRQEITYDIIDRSHLVVNFVDSAFAGNIHDLNFVKRIMKWRGRQVFFVLNKADKLDAADIDPQGQRGPAKSLRDAFHRHDIPIDGKLFFLSGYRALRAQQLRNGELGLADLEEDNRLGISDDLELSPADAEGLAEALAGHLLEESRFAALKTGLLDFLANENRTAAVLDTASRFLENRADSFAVPLDNELALAKDPTKFDELRASRETLIARLAALRASADHELLQFRAKSKGGKVQGVLYEGYAGRFRHRLGTTAIQEHVVAPTMAWLREGQHLKDARKQKFKPLAARLEHQIDEFVSRELTGLQEEMRAEEQAIEDVLARLLGEVRGMRPSFAAPPPLDAAKPEGGTLYSGTWYDQGGAIFGAAAGAVVGSVFPVIGTVLGAGLGGVLGAAGKLLSRITWNDEKWIQKLEPLVRSGAMNTLLHGATNDQGQRVAPVLEAVSTHLLQRTDTFCGMLQAEVDNAIANVQREIDDLLDREEQIRRESAAIIARLEPKVALLAGIRENTAAWLRPEPSEELVAR